MQPLKGAFLHADVSTESKEAEGQPRTVHCSTGGPPAEPTEQDSSACCSWLHRGARQLGKVLFTRRRHRQPERARAQDAPAPQQGSQGEADKDQQHRISQGSATPTSAEQFGARKLCNVLCLAPWRRQAEGVDATLSKEDQLKWQASDFPKKAPWYSHFESKEHYNGYVASFVGKPVNLGTVGDAELRRRIAAGDFGPEEPLPAEWKKDLAKGYLMNT